MFYRWHEFRRLALQPAQLAAASYREMMRNPFNPFAHTFAGRSSIAAMDAMASGAGAAQQPSFALTSTVVDGRAVSVEAETVWRRPFCDLVRLRRDISPARNEDDPRLLVIPPYLGLHATAFAPFIRRFLPFCDVFVAVWRDARLVPAADGAFGLADQIGAIVDMCEFFGGDVHAIGADQASAPLFAAVAMLEAQGGVRSPHSQILIDGSIDARVNPTPLSAAIREHGIDWLRGRIVRRAPWPETGHGRELWPSEASLEDTVGRAGESFIAVHREADAPLLDAPAECALQSIDAFIVKHALASEELFIVNGVARPSAIVRCALMTFEMGPDALRGPGQCAAAHRLAISVPPSRRETLQRETGDHEAEMARAARRIVRFMARHDRRPGLRGRVLGVLAKYFRLTPRTKQTV
ncbi:MAG: hypothetical protein NW215_10110 [Hyphomicrobiales bacterium]|nr:hypothetical protein [Hyphomicrobiales bacterium]